jgi:hypothetical protein
MMMIEKSLLGLNVESVKSLLGVNVLVEKYLLGVNVGGYSPLFSAKPARKKSPPALSYAVACKKTLNINTLHPPIIQAIRTGLNLSFNHVKGVFHILNTLFGASFIPKNQ